MDPYVGEIRMFTYLLPTPGVPAGWLPCDGQMLKLDFSSPYQVLAAVIGNTYGGDFRDGTFALPNLMGYAPVGAGKGPGLSDYPIGQSAGEQSTALTLAQIPSHSHDAALKPGSPTTLIAGNSVMVCNPAVADLESFKTHGASAQEGTIMPGFSEEAAQFSAKQFSSAGGDARHENRQPFLAFMFCIAYRGVFPARP